MKKCVIITPHFEPYVNGVSTVATSQAKMYEAQGYNVYVVSSRGTNWQQGKHCECDLIGYRDSKNKLSKEFIKIDNFIFDIVPDVIVVHCWLSWTAGYLASRIKKFKHTFNAEIVLHSHAVSELDIWDYSIKGLARYIRGLMRFKLESNKIFPFLDQIYVLDRCKKKSFQDIGLAIKNGVRVSVKRNKSIFSDSSCDVYSGKSGVLTVANFDKIKGYDRLLKIAKLCPHTEFHVCGSHENTISAQLRNENLKNLHIHIGLSGSSLIEMYSRCKIYLCSSYWEAQSVSVIDAMVFGMPIVSFDVGTHYLYPSIAVVNNIREASSQIKYIESDDKYYDMMVDISKINSKIFS